jgi:hypothetical protein
MIRRLVALVVLGIAGVACGAALTPADQAGIADDAAIIARCEAAGRACKIDGGHDCYGVYDACMRDGGLH